MTVHAPYEAARILGPQLGAIPGQRTMKSECGKRVPITDVTWGRPTCEACRTRIVSDARARYNALASLVLDAQDDEVRWMRSEAMDALNHTILSYGGAPE